MEKGKSDTLLDGIYAAVLDDSAFHDLPQRIAATTGGSSCFMALHDHPRQSMVIGSDFRINRDFVAAYQREFIRYDPWEPIVSALSVDRFHIMDRYIS